MSLKVGVVYDRPEDDLDPDDVDLVKEMVAISYGVDAAEVTVVMLDIDLQCLTPGAPLTTVSQGTVSGIDLVWHNGDPIKDVALRHAMDALGVPVF